MASTISPFFEFLSLMTFGLSWVYSSEWVSFQGVIYSIPLLIQSVSLIFGILIWISLYNNTEHITKLIIMHGVTEFVTFLVGALSFGVLIFFRLRRSPPSGSQDIRVLEEMIVSATFTLIGSAFGIIVFLCMMPISKSRTKKIIIADEDRTMI